MYCIKARICIGNKTFLVMCPHGLFSEPDKIVGTIEIMQAAAAEEIAAVIHDIAKPVKPDRKFLYGDQSV